MRLQVQRAASDTDWKHMQVYFTPPEPVLPILGSAEYSDPVVEYSGPGDYATIRKATNGSSVLRPGDYVLVVKTSSKYLVHVRRAWDRVVAYRDCAGDCVHRWGFVF